MSRFRPSRPSSVAPSSRIQVCPPGTPRAWQLRPDPAWRRVARRFGLLPPAPAERLETARRAFLASLDGLASPQSRRWRGQVMVSQSLHELWHLRSALFEMVAAQFSEAEAARRLTALDAHFPTRALRSGLAAPDF